uniref:Beta-1,4-N-acetylgalactosaminyltransferase n=1 Tax=Hirondellea gigas TaxID=1518452 RepID=A0A2P2IBE9_9CRUS
MGLRLWIRRRGAVSTAVLLVCSAGVGMCLLSVLYLSGALQQGCDCSSFQSKRSESLKVAEGQHKLAVLVPLRDRFEELQDFVVHLSQFLEAQSVQHQIFAINQVDNLRFNRASLLNVGFLEAGEDFDYVALHDVDLLPNTQDLTYFFPETGPFHLAAPHLHPRYHYPTFIGGVLLLTRKQMIEVNGLSNVYWGWGLEDDELFARLRDAHLVIHRPGNITAGLKSFRHMHDRRVRKRDQIRCFDQQLLTRRRDRRTGLSTVRYTLLERRELTVDGAAVSVLNVQLQCSRQQTPWCDCVQNTGNSPKEKRREIIHALPPEDVIAPKIDWKKHISPDG